MIDWPAVDDDPDELRPAAPEPAAPSAWRSLLELPLLVVLAAVVAIAVKAFLAQAFFIPSPSMEPQLTEGDRVVVSRLAYRLHEPRRGDVIVFDEPGQTDSDDRFVLVRWGSEALEAIGLVEPDTKELIKRVIGLPGETVEGRDGGVVVNGRSLIEPYLPPGVTTSDFGPVVVPADHVFVLGDNRSNSKDSRFIGPVPIDTVVGRAIARVWPPGRIAYL